MQGYSRTPEGYLSWQHLLFVTSLILLMAVSAVVLGRKNRGKCVREKNRVLIVAAILIDAFELLKIILHCVASKEADRWLYELPLFLCSIQLIALPLAAFSKGKIKEASLDFVFIFGLLGALLGTYGAGQNYNAYPVLSFDNVVSGITHAISGFSALYIVISGMQSMKKRNILPTALILLGFCVVAYVVNVLIDYNYMFLMRDDGTPYQIVYSLVKGNEVLYPLCVAGLFFVYIFGFYLTYFAIGKTKSKVAM